MADTLHDIYAELVKLSKSRGFTLHLNENKFTGPTQRLNWTCECGCNVVSTGNSLLKNDDLCGDCFPKTGKVVWNKKTYNQVVELYAEHGCTLVTPESEYRDIRTPVEWICVCGKTKYSTVQSFISSKSKKCASCSIKAGKCDKSQYDDFSRELANKGWKMVSRKDEYLTTKSKMQVINSKGKEVTTSFDRFKTACKKETFDVNNVGIIKSTLIEKGYEWIDGKSKYVNRDTKLTVLCSGCGTERDVTLNSARRKQTSFGCSDCTLSGIRHQKCKIELLKKCFILRSPSYNLCEGNTIRIRCVKKNHLVLIDFNQLKYLNSESCKKC